MDKMEYIDKKFEQIEGIGDAVEYTKSLTQLLRMIHPSDAYKIITELIKPKNNFKIIKCKRDDVKVYQEFQDLMQNAKKSADHDKLPATMLDVDMACTKVYGTTVLMIRTLNDTGNNRFTKITQAINRIEERLGMDVTDFKEDDEDDSTNNENEQRIEETADGSGDTGKTE